MSCLHAPSDAGDLLFDGKNAAAEIGRDIFDLTPFIKLPHQRLLSSR